MNAPAKIEAAPLARLREPFPANQISKLPKPTKQQTDEVRADYKKGIRCQICGSWHHPNVVHLDYVGHAALTDRLLDTDPEWNWEPMGLNPDGTPALDKNGGLWIKLTVCGVTRPGYGCADGKTGGDAMKEIIGDALRNAAMRFGAALDLWHKGDLHAGPPSNDHHTPEPEPKAERVRLEGPYTSKTRLWAAVRVFDREIRSCGDDDTLSCLLTTDDSKALIEQLERDAPQLLHGGENLPPEFEPLNTLIERMRGEFAEQNDDWKTNPARSG